MGADQPQTDRELLLEIHGDVKTLVKCAEDHETRIRGLESGIMKVFSIGALIGLISGWFGGKIGGNL